MGHILVDMLEQRLSHPVHQAALAYWRQRRWSVSGLPGRQDIDPLDIPGLLPWVNLIEVHRFPEGLRFRHRLVGTAIVEVRERDGTGCWFHDLYRPGKLERAQRKLEQVVRAAEPALFDADLDDIGKPYWKQSSLILPLASDHRRVDMLMGVSQYS